MDADEMVPAEAAVPGPLRLSGIAAKARNNTPPAHWEASIRIRLAATPLFPKVVAACNETVRGIARSAKVVPLQALVWIRFANRGWIGDDR